MPTSLGTNELPVCNISSANVATLIPTGGVGIGNIRGVVVAMHGLSVVAQPIPPVATIGNSTVSGYPGSGPNFDANLLNDGWIILTVPYLEDYYVGIGATGIWNDINSDASNGSRYLLNQMHWWDHVVDYIHTTYDPDIPIVPFGISWGGYHTLQIAINRQSTIAAYCADLPATLVAYVNPAYSAPANYGPNAVVSGQTYSTPLTGGTGGLDIQPTALTPGYTSQIGVTNTNGVTVPGCILFGTNDGAAGWQDTGSIQGVLPINSNIDAILTNATAASIPVTRIQTTNTHAFLNPDAGYSATYINTGPTSLSSINSSGVLNIQNIGGTLPAGIQSGQCAIYASDDAWHNITFTNFGFTSYTSTAVSNVVTSMPSTLTLGSTTGLTVTSGSVSIALTNGNAVLAGFTGVSGNNLTGVTYSSIVGTAVTTNAIGATTSGYMGANIVSLNNYCVTSITGVNTMTGSTTLTLSSTVGLCTTGGTLSIVTDKVFEGTNLNAVVTYATVSGSTITGVTYVSGANFFGYGNITGGQVSSVYLITPITGVTIASPGSATVSSGAPVSTFGQPIPGGYMNMSLPYWFSQNVDPICPRKF